jgi:hypothetical protein
LIIVFLLFWVTCLITDSSTFIFISEANSLLLFLG